MQFIDDITLYSSNLLIPTFHKIKGGWWLRNLLFLESFLNRLITFPKCFYLILVKPPGGSYNC